MTSVRSSATVASHCACAAESGDERSKSIGVCAQCHTLTTGGEFDRALEHLSISRSIKLCFWSNKKSKEQCQICTQPSSIRTKLSFRIELAALFGKHRRPSERFMTLRLHRALMHVLATPGRSPQQTFSREKHMKNSRRIHKNLVLDTWQIT